MMKISLLTSGAPPRLDACACFTYHLHVFDERRATGNLFGSLYAGAACEACERLVAICSAIGADNGEITISGPWYDPNPLALQLSGSAARYQAAPIARWADAREKPHSLCAACHACR